jgi:zinc protease
MIESHFAALPAGEEVPPPGEPGAPKSSVPAAPKAARATGAGGEPTACLAYLAPRPDSEHYAAFLVLVSRLWANGVRFDGPGVTGSPVFYTPLDDGSVVAISARIRPGETSDGAFKRIEAFVAEAIEPKLNVFEARTVQQGELGLVLGLDDLAGEIMKENPYGLAFSLARRDQLGLDAARLNKALKALTDRDLKRAAAEIFAPSRYAGAVAGYTEPGR